jgi:hypothetical protein
VRGRECDSVTSMPQCMRQPKPRDCVHGVCALFVLDSVTSTPQCIHQPKPRDMLHVCVS